MPTAKGSREHTSPLADARCNQNVATCPAVVVLNGGVTTKIIKDDNIVDWSDPDRFFAGLSAVQYKKVDKVIFTRGKMPWSASMPEGEVLSGLLGFNLGVEFGQILFIFVILLPLRMLLQDLPSPKIRWSDILASILTGYGVFLFVQRGLL